MRFHVEEQEQGDTWVWEKEKEHDSALSSLGCEDLSVWWHDDYLMFCKLILLRYWSIRNDIKWQKLHFCLNAFLWLDNEHACKNE